VCEGPRPYQRDRIVDGSVVGNPAPRKCNSSGKATCKVVKVVAGLAVEEEIEVGANLQTKTLQNNMVIIRRFKAIEIRTKNSV
jgi:hypothetical protein